MNNIYELFYKIIENPRCLKYYQDLINYYNKNNEKEKKKIYEINIKKIINEDSNNNSN